MPPVTGFWLNVWHSFSPRNYSYKGRIYEVNNSGYALPRVYNLEMPAIGVKTGFNTVYKGIKRGVPYIGKAFNVFKG